MWRCIDIAQTDVSEERIASIFRVEEKREKNLRARNQREQEAPNLGLYYVYTAPDPRRQHSSLE
jgi:hypothetical protein